MFEISIGAFLALILLFLFPSLLIATLYMLGFTVFSAISGSLTYFLASWLGVIAQNAFWIGAIIGFLTGAFATHYLSRLRNGHRISDRMALR